MKIGILTYHRAENYGALLQAYALMNFLAKRGHTVSFIDYWPQYHIEHYKILSSLKWGKYGIKGKISMLLWAIPRYIRKYRLQKFMYQKLLLNKHVRYKNDSDTTEHYDIAIYGSDQIWRKQDINAGEFNLWYFGASNVKASKDRKSVV